MATVPAKKSPAKPVVEMVTVRAIDRGYDNVAVREPGDVFEMPRSAVEEHRNTKDKWFEPVDES